MDYIYSFMSLEGVIEQGQGSYLSEVDLIIDLEKRGYFILDIREKPHKKPNPIKTSKIKDKEIALIAGQIYILLNSGITLKDALMVIKEDTTYKDRKDLMDRLMGELDKGTMLSELFKDRDKFRILYSLLKSGEESGMMEIAFKRISEFYENEDLIRSKIFTVLLYPIILIIATFVVSFFIVYSVLPNILDLFIYTDNELPKMTMILLTTMNIISKYKIFLIIIFLITILQGLYIYKKRRYIFDRFFFKIPLINRYLKSLFALRFLESQRLLLLSGVNLLRTIEISKDIINNAYVEEKFDKVLVDVNLGKQLSESLFKYGIFPNIVVSMIKVGEGSGQIHLVLDKAVDYLKKDLEKNVDRVFILLEPIILIFIALLVGILVISIITPIFNMNDLVF